MKLISFINRYRAQMAMEYLLILAVAVVIVFVGYKTFIPKIGSTTEGYYNAVTTTILNGEEAPPVDGGWCPVECASGAESTCGNGIRYRTCECPAPAFGGEYCSYEPLTTDTIKCKGDYCECLKVSPCASLCAPEVDAQGVEVCYVDNEPACGQITNGVNSCGNPCSKFGPAPPCD